MYGNKSFHHWGKTLSLCDRMAGKIRQGRHTVDYEGCFWKSFSYLSRLHPAEFSRLEGACSLIWYYLLGQLDSNQMLDSMITRKETIEEISEHFTGIAMMSLVAKLISLSRFDSNDKYYSKGVTEVGDIKQKFIRRKLLFPVILYVALFLMMLETESVVKDEIMWMVNERYLDITLEKVILTCSSYTRDIELSK